MASRAILSSRVASLAVAVAALSVVAGWLLRIPGLTSLYLPGPTLKTNAALSLACLGIANLLLVAVPAGNRWRRLAPLLAIVAIVVGTLTLSEHVAGWNLGIDELLATERAGAVATASPNRMGPLASTSNVLLGISLLTIDSRRRRTRAAGHLCAFITCAVALLPLLGYAYGVTELYMVARLTGIALVTAVALLILGLAIQAGRPDSGLVSLLCRTDEVGVFARRLLVAGVLLPFSIGWVLIGLMSARLVDGPFAISTMALVLIVLLAGLIWQTGRHLARSSDARAETEQALAASERSLRQADQQKSEFLATLSHELRNPLAPMRFAVEMLAGPPAMVERARQTIERQVRHLTRLVDDLLDLTRISSNKLELHAGAYELGALIGDAIDAVAGEMKRGNHSLTVDRPAERVWLRVDRDRVVQLLVNLLTNAVRYADAGSAVHVAAVVGDVDVAISVRDTGHGIAAEDLGRVFERFVQVGRNRHGGLGIGLALVKELAELHGGRVEARSEGPGRGAEFIVHLPRAAEPAAEEGPATSSPMSSLRILIVDDNRDAADTLGAVLQAAGHQVAIMYDPHEALLQAGDFAPDVGLLDIGMPGMSGYELAGQLRSQVSGRRLFLVAITGWGQRHDHERALAAGFDAHVTKPADPEAIAALIAQGCASPVESPLPGPGTR